jgi:hypothetical protein
MSFIESYYHFFDMVIASFLGVIASKIMELPPEQQYLPIFVFIAIAALMFGAVRMPSIYNYLEKRLKGN